MATRDLRIFLFYFHWKSGGICADCGRIVAIVAAPGGAADRTWSAPDTGTLGLELECYNSAYLNTLLCMPQIDEKILRSNVIHLKHLKNQEPKVARHL